MDKNIVQPKDVEVASQSSIEALLPGATKLTPLELNNIKLDDKHTLLTPDYLENLSKEGAE